MIGRMTTSIRRGVGSGGIGKRRAGRARGDEVAVLTGEGAAPRGSKGDQGARGPKGDIGPAGRTGERGTQGTPGLPGKTGSPGAVSDREPLDRQAVFVRLMGHFDGLYDQLHIQVERMSEMQQELRDVHAEMDRLRAQFKDFSDD